MILRVKPSSTAASQRMMAVRQKNTSPESEIRRELRSLGFQIRCNGPDLPGTPDIVFPDVRVAIFVHGCFWHRHKGCPRATTPKANRAFWTSKFDDNVRRDGRVSRRLRSAGWRVFVIWECQVKKDAIRQAERVCRLLLTIPSSLTRDRMQRH